MFRGMVYVCMQFIEKYFYKNMKYVKIFLYLRARKSLVLRN